MGTRRQVPIQLVLSYETGDEVAGEVYRNRPIPPSLGDSLLLAVRRDWDADEAPTAEELGSSGVAGTPQIWIVGTAEGLEALGTYLVGLARLETLDPTPHAHFDVSNADGGVAHLIVRREEQLPVR